MREFYSPVEIVGYRGFYLMLSRIKPIRNLFHQYLERIEHKESVVIYDALLHKVDIPTLDDIW